MPPQVTVTGSDGSTYTLAATGGTQSVSPTATTTYTATATGAGGTATATATVTVTKRIGAYRDHRRQPHFDHRGGSSTLTVTATNATAGDCDRIGWQQLYPVVDWRNANCQPGHDNDLHRGRDRIWRQRFGERDRDRDAGREQ